MQPASPAPIETLDLPVAMAGLSRHTQRAYLRHICLYLASIHGLDVAAIDVHHLPTIRIAIALKPAALRDYLGAHKQRGLGGHALGQIRSAVLWVAGLLVDLRRADGELVAALKRIPVPAAETGQRGSRWLTVEEIKAILLAAPTVKGVAPSAAIRNLCIITFLAVAGLRREEVARATWADLVKLGEHWALQVHGKGAKLRYVKLPPMALDALNTWQDHHPLPDGDRAIFTQLWKGGVVTSQALSPKAVWEIVDGAARAAGFRDVTPHMLRRSFARGAFEAGASFELIRQALGHERIQTTERYVNAVLELDRAATDVVAEGLNED